MFVEATPKSEYLRSVKKLVRKHKLKIKVVEKVGQTIKHVLQRSDPYQKNICNLTAVLYVQMIFRSTAGKGE